MQQVGTLPAKTPTWVKRVTGHLGQMIGGGIIFVAILMLVLTLWSIFGRQPPIQIESLDPAIINDLCSGSRITATLDVKITAPAIIVYYISVMNKTEERQLIGTQEVYRGLPYPRVGHFTQILPWTVPNLPPGNYVRVVAAIGSNGSDKPEMEVTRFNIKRCLNDH